MARMGAMQLGLPEFRGATRRLVLANLVAYFALLVLGWPRRTPPVAWLATFLHP